MKIGIVGSRKRNSGKDLRILEEKFVEILREHYLNIDFQGNNLKKVLKDLTIVSGDCDEGGDFFAKYLSSIYRCALDEKKIKHPQTGEEMDFKNHRWFDYYTMVRIFYKRNEEIVKEPLDYLIALVTPNRKGGTENTIKHFKRYHKDWEEKLIIL